MDPVMRDMYMRYSMSKQDQELIQSCLFIKAWVKVFRINPEFRILRLTFHRKSASKC